MSTIPVSYNILNTYRCILNYIGDIFYTEQRYALQLLVEWITHTSLNKTFLLG